MYMAKKNKLAKPKPGPATQRFLDIEQIRDNIVILKDGTVRSVLLVSSINFALKSADEQEAIVQSYIQFLNGLDSPMQISIQSRQMNIEPYINSLKDQRKQMTNELLRAQIDDYMSFIQELLQLGQIMQKRFYVVINYDPVSDKKNGFFARFGSALSPSVSTKLSDKKFNELKEKLDRKTDIIAGQLGSLGVQAVRLDTQTLIELYYSSYNPDIFDLERMSDIGNLRVE